MTFLLITVLHRQSYAVLCLRSVSGLSVCKSYLQFIYSNLTLAITYVVELLS